MIKNIVYLLGAGASYHSVPVVEKMPNRMSLFVSLLRDYFPDEFESFKKLDKIIEDIKFYGTPDTLARKLYLASSTDLHIKNFVSSFLIYEQLHKTSDVQDLISSRLTNGIKEDKDENVNKGINNELDLRYLSFFATIFKKDKEEIVLPKNISILSWNYDLQLERAYQEFRNCSINKAQLDLNVLPAIETETISEKIENEFSVLKLNGSAGFYDPNSKSPDELFDPKKHTTDSLSMKILRDLNIQSRVRLNSIMHFAWETENAQVIKAREIALEKIKRASVLVIIGYSFPDFNRIIDKQLFSSENLSKIYLQDPNANDIIQKFEGIRKGLRDKTQIITQTQNFTIPLEFWE